MHRCISSPEGRAALRLELGVFGRRFSTVLLLQVTLLSVGQAL